MATTKKATTKKAPAKGTTKKTEAKEPAAKKPAATNGQPVAQPVDYVHEIGSTAGEIWCILQDNGTMTVAALVRKSTAGRDMVMQAIGWLAREDKITLEGDRSRQISLR